ncbi:MAG: hypothetical protein AB1555_07265 [Nitrospirota bacterium]
MNSRIAVIVLPVPREQVFRYLASIRNLPRWATEFCSELKQVDGKHKVVTCAALGKQELLFEIRADEKTGVIDMITGPSEDQMALFSCRVVELRGGSTAFLFTMFQFPETDDEHFERQYQSLEREFENVKKALLGSEKPPTQVVADL